MTKSYNKSPPSFSTPFAHSENRRVRVFCLKNVPAAPIEGEERRKLAIAIVLAQSMFVLFQHDLRVSPSTYAIRASYRVPDNQSYFNCNVQEVKTRLRDPVSWLLPGRGREFTQPSLHLVAEYCNLNFLLKSSNTTWTGPPILSISSGADHHRSLASY